MLKVGKQACRRIERGQRLQARDQHFLPDSPALIAHTACCQPRKQEGGEKGGKLDFYEGPLRLCRPRTSQVKMLNRGKRGTNLLKSRCKQLQQGRTIPKLNEACFKAWEEWQTHCSKKIKKSIFLIDDSLILSGNMMSLSSSSWSNKMPFDCIRLKENNKTNQGQSYRLESNLPAPPWPNLAVKRL